MIENANPAKAERILPPPVSEKKEYDRYFQTEYDSKGLNRRLLSGGELSYPENLESLDLIQSAPGNLFATALMTLPRRKKSCVEVGRGQPKANTRLHRWTCG